MIFGFPQHAEDIGKTKEEREINLKAHVNTIVSNFLDDTPEITIAYRVGKIQQVTIRPRPIKVAFPWREQQ